MDYLHCDTGNSSFQDGAVLRILVFEFDSFAFRHFFKFNVDSIRHGVITADKDVASFCYCHIYEGAIGG